MIDILKSAARAAGEGIAPGEWTHGASGPVMVCPVCHNALSLARHKVAKVNPDGSAVLFPPVRCAYDGCTFQNAVKLIGWQEANNG